MDLSFADISHWSNWMRPMLKRIHYGQYSSTCIITYAYVSSVMSWVLLSPDFFFLNEHYLSQILLNKLSLVSFMLSLYLLAPGPHTWLWQLLSAPAVCICCQHKQLILTVFSLSHTFILMSRSLLCCDMGHSDNSRGSLFWEKIGCLSFSNRDFVV